MSPRERAVWLLGAAQCIYWGVLYYGFAVLLVPMRSELGISESVLAGAFSVGLAMWALLGPSCGKMLDRGQGGKLLGLGAANAAGLLVLWSFVQAAWQLYLVWAGLGAAMAAILYETAFGLVIRAVADVRERLNALARITILGGLASTVFVPLAAWGVETAGWRATLRFDALVVLLVAALLERAALPALSAPFAAPSSPAGLAPEAGPASAHPGPAKAELLRLGAPFVAATFAATALGALAIPALVDRGHSLAVASGLMALLGASQLPGRVWMSMRRASPRNLLVLPLLLQLLGFALLGLLPHLAGAAAGISLVGLGGGLHTLARPWVVPHLYGTAAAGRINGSIAGLQGLARAAGPFAALTCYMRTGAGAVFVGLALLLLATVPWALRTASRAAARDSRQEGGPEVLASALRR